MADDPKYQPELPDLGGLDINDQKDLNAMLEKWIGRKFPHLDEPHKTALVNECQRLLVRGIDSWLRKNKGILTVCMCLPWHGVLGHGSVE